MVNASLRSNNEAGFSLIEMMIAASVMLIVLVSIVSLLRSSLSVASTTYELTEAQESVRTAQEYINRDLLNSGDGLKSITYIPVNTTFVQNFLSFTPIVDPNNPPLATNLGILTTDNNVAAGKTAPPPPPPPGPPPVPAATPIRIAPGTDRQTILEIDGDLTSNPIFTPTAVSAAGDLVTLPAATTATHMALFVVGDIYFMTSARGGTFATVTAINTGTKVLTFASGVAADYCGLNTAGANNRIKDISASGTLPTTLQRMKIIHYFVDSNQLLRRRVFGERGASFRDSIIAEHVLGVQFIYSLGIDAGGNPVKPTDVISTPAQQVNVSQVEVRVSVETAHVMLHNKQKPPPITMSSTTSLRNMQFRQALQPKPSPTP